MNSIITTAIVTAIANLSKDAIKDSYNALKAALKNRFGEESDLVDAVEQLEKKPESEARRSILQEEVEIAKADGESSILQLAQALINQLQNQPNGQDTINQTQTNTVSGINVGGNFEFKPTQNGKRG